jgi:hypothetical protein
MANEKRFFLCSFSGRSYQSNRNASVWVAMFHGESVDLAECAVVGSVNVSVRYADPLKASSVLEQQLLSAKRRRGI